ncbi:DUF547 domain-containing protein [Leptolyngbya iicbica]|uniref:DUF547 domain-containing protein n=2 Tax=Cyanophyceae TaxID=3028117 RepID=A0A4Q7EEB2_9CYAN|nr:DUF547 domain-containing protein [Leptolyngbya sp. LK]RZM79595.1 DUF547 domain-containing protein [Leptolyngbya sp. LK]
MPDFAPWDTMLKRYVNDCGQVDYAAWQSESYPELDAWLESLSVSELSTLERDEAIALLLNLYNALTIRQVLQKYPIASIRPTFLGVPNWLVFLRFFNRTVYHLNEQPLSLNGIEHGLLRARFSDPRIHFALVCASVGCPLLRTEAYEPARLAEQLTEDVRRFIGNDDKVRYDATQQTLYCSKIFQWYATDFLTVADSMPDYICQHRPELNLPERVTVQFLPYSWALNQRTSS